MNRFRQVRLLGAALLLVLVLLAFAGYTAVNSDRIKQQNSDYALDAAEDMADHVMEDMDLALTNVKTYAYFFSKDMTSGMIDLEALKAAEDASPFDGLRYTDINGVNYAADGSTSEAQDRDYYQNGIKGESGVTVIFSSRINAKTMIGFYAPVYFNNQICGVLRGVYNADDYLRKLLERDYYGEKAYTYLCNEQGEIIAAGSDTAEHEKISGKSVTEYLSETIHIGETENADILSAITEKQERVVYVNENEVTDSISVTHIKKGNFVLVQLFPRNVDQRMIKDSNAVGGVLLGVLLLLFLGYIILFSVSSVKEQKQIAADNRDKSYVADSVRNLIEEFVLVDIEESTFRYLYGTKPYVESMPKDGPYSLLLDAIVNHLYDKKQEGALREKLSLGNISKLLARSENDTFLETIHLQFPDAESWSNMNVITIEKNGGEPSKILMTRQDVTQLKESDLMVQNQLRQSCDEAGKVNRVKSGVLSLVLEEMHTLSNMFTNANNSILREKQLEVIYEHAGMIENAGRGFQNLYNDIQDLSKLEKGQLEILPVQYDVSELVLACSNIMTKSFENKGLEFKCMLDENIPTALLGDEVRIRQIIVDLLINTLRYTEKGNVTLKLNCYDTVSGMTKRNESDMFLEIIISDTGAGFLPEEISVLGKSVEAILDSKSEGNAACGMGYLIVKMLVEQMHGTLLVESVVGAGTIYTVCLPQQVINPLPIGKIDLNKNKQSQQSDFVAPFKAQGVKILAVDEIPDSLKLFKLLLMETGIHVDVLKGKIPALSILRRQKYDLIYVDYQMSNGGAAEILKELRSDEGNLNQATPIVAIAASAVYDYAEQAAREGFADYLSKPIDGQQLYATVQKYVDAAKLTK